MSATQRVLQTSELLYLIFKKIPQSKLPNFLNVNQIFFEVLVAIIWNTLTFTQLSRLLRAITYPSDFSYQYSYETLYDRLACIYFPCVQVLFASSIGSHANGPYEEHFFQNVLGLSLPQVLFPNLRSIFVALNSGQDHTKFFQFLHLFQPLILQNVAYQVNGHSHDMIQVMSELLNHLPSAHRLHLRFTHAPAGELILHTSNLSALRSLILHNVQSNIGKLFQVASTLPCLHTLKISWYKDEDEDKTLSSLRAAGPFNFPYLYTLGICNSPALFSYLQTSRDHFTAHHLHRLEYFQYPSHLSPHRTYHSCYIHLPVSFPLIHELAIHALVKRKLDWKFIQSILTRFPNLTGFQVYNIYFKNLKRQNLLKFFQLRPWTVLTVPIGRSSWSYHILEDLRIYSPTLRSLSVRFSNQKAPQSTNNRVIRTPPNLSPFPFLKEFIIFNENILIRDDPHFCCNCPHWCKYLKPFSFLSHQHGRISINTFSFPLFLPDCDDTVIYSPE